MTITTDPPTIESPETTPDPDTARQLLARVTRQLRADSVFSFDQTPDRWEDARRWTTNYGCGEHPHRPSADDAVRNAALLTGQAGVTALTELHGDLGRVITQLSRQADVTGIHGAALTRHADRIAESAEAAALVVGAELPVISEALDTATAAITTELPAIARAVETAADALQAIAASTAPRRRWWHR